MSIAQMSIVYMSIAYMSNVHCLNVRCLHVCCLHVHYLHVCCLHVYCLHVHCLVASGDWEKILLAKVLLFERGFVNFRILQVLQLHFIYIIHICIYPS